jgi:hypothetical protein
MSAPTIDRFEAARAVADAVLYEGYVLYPYRASATKNQFRWQFGVLSPRSVVESDGAERWSVRTECVADPGATAVLHVRVRALHLQRRTVEGATGRPGEFEPRGRLEVDGVVHLDWDEAVEAVVDLPPLALDGLTGPGYRHDFVWERSSEIEELHRADGSVAGRIVRARTPVQGEICVALVDGRFPLISVTVANVTAGPGPGAPREQVLTHSLLGVHTMLALDDGRFVSLLDPPADAAVAVGACRSEGAYPVLIGRDDVVLSSPIILYDHPEVAPESPGDLYDATEIDEILALRVLTLTDDEKAEARVTDPRAAAVIDRCDTMPAATWERLHGTLREVELAAPPESASVPWWDPGADASVDPGTEQVLIAGTPVGRKSAVRLRPSRRADAQDLFLAGRTATVAGVFRDVEDETYVAVTLDDDPMAAELEWQGRYLYFYPDELEPL